MRVNHNFNLITVKFFSYTLYTEKEKINVKNLQNSDQGQRQDNFMISYYTCKRLVKISEKLTSMVLFYNSFWIVKLYKMYDIISF